MANTTESPIGREFPNGFHSNGEKYADQFAGNVKRVITDADNTRRPHIGAIC